MCNIQTSSDHDSSPGQKVDEVSSHLALCQGNEVAQNKAEATQNLVEPVKKTAEVAEPMPEVAKENTEVGKENTSVAKAVLLIGKTRNDAAEKAAEPTKKTAEVAKPVPEVAKKATESDKIQKETRQAPGRVAKSAAPSPTQNQVAQHPIQGQKAAQDQVNEEPKSNPTSKISSKTGSDETSADKTGNAAEEADEAPIAMKKQKTVNAKKTAASKKKATEQVVAPKRPTRSRTGGQNQKEPEQVPHESPLQSGANTLTVQEVCVTLSTVRDESVTPSCSSEDDWIDGLEKKKQARVQSQLSQVTKNVTATVPSVAVAAPTSDDLSQEDWLVDPKKKKTTAAKLSKMQPSKAADKKSSKTDDLKSTKSAKNVKKPTIKNQASNKQVDGAPKVASKTIDEEKIDSYENYDVTSDVDDVTSDVEDVIEPEPSKPRSKLTRQTSKDLNLGAKKKLDFVEDSFVDEEEIPLIQIKKNLKLSSKKALSSKNAKTTKKIQFAPQKKVDSEPYQTSPKEKEIKIVATKSQIAASKSQNASGIDAEIENEGTRESGDSLRMNDINATSPAKATKDSNPLKKSESPSIRNLKEATSPAKASKEAVTLADER